LRCCLSLSLTSVTSTSSAMNRTASDSGQPESPESGGSRADRAAIAAASKRVQVQACGDAWVMVEWGAHAKANTAARALAARLRESPEPFAIEVVAGVRTLALRLATGAAFDHRAKHRADAISWLKQIAPQALDWEAPVGREVIFPACYDPSMAPDLEAVAGATGLTSAEVVRLHSARPYTAEVVGFMPGFAYLGGLDPRLKLDRRTVPRPRVPEGGIAIAGLQSAIYPSPTAGGWHLIGRCPLRLFDPDRSPAALMTEGDTIRFEPIDKAEFERLWARR
jgi:inhibitor of KinA